MWKIDDKKKETDKQSNIKLETTRTKGGQYFPLGQQYLFWVGVARMYLFRLWQFGLR